MARYLHYYLGLFTYAVYFFMKNCHKNTATKYFRQKAVAHFADNYPMKLRGGKRSAPLSNQD